MRPRGHARDARNLDGSQIETLVETGRGDADRRDQTRWCVGITIDPDAQQIYWTQKGPDNGGPGPHLSRRHRYPQGRDRRQPLRHRSLVRRLPEPIDLELDLKNRVLYWTDRGDPPRGNTVNRAPIDAKPRAPEILITHLMEGIGIALDVPGDRMFVTDFGGSVYSANLDGSERAQLPLRPGQSHRHRLRRNLKSRSKENQSCPNKPIRRVAIIGTGVIGASWTALFLAKGLDVVATDVAPDAEAALRTLREGGLAGARAIGPCARRVAVAPDVHGRPGGSSRERGPRPGERARADRLQEEALSAARRAAAARRDHRLELVGADHERNPVGLPRRIRSAASSPIRSIRRT